MRFGGHETFAIREGWLHKGVKLLVEDPELLMDENACDFLGVGRNMAKSIRHWLVATGLAKPCHERKVGNKSSLEMTDFGELVWSHDPYFTEIGTWWAIHINLVNCSEHALTWTWFFNSFNFDRFDRSVCLEAPLSMIRSAKLLTDNAKYVAAITLKKGECQQPTWCGLQRYWAYAKPSECPAVSCSTTGPFVVFCLTVSQGQGGIIAIWNCHRRRWEHVSQADYVSTAMLLDDQPTVVSFHFISSYMTPGHHSIFAFNLDRTRDGFKELLKPIRFEYESHGFHPSDRDLSQAAYCSFANQHEQGPLGIFRLANRSSFIAHDAGNLYKFCIADIQTAISV